MSYSENIDPTRVACTHRIVCIKPISGIRAIGFLFSIGFDTYYEFDKLGFMACKP